METEFFGHYDYPEEYKEKLEIVLERARMGEDEGIHLVVSPEQDPLF